MRQQASGRPHDLELLGDAQALRLCRVSRHAGAPNKATADVRAATREHTGAAIARLVHLMTHAASEAAQVAAAKELLDRAHGRPAQMIAGDPDGVPIRTVNRIEFVVVDPDQT